MKKIISYSEISTWYYSRPEWIEKYVKGNYPEPSREMRLGSIIHEAIEGKLNLPEVMTREGFSTKEIFNARKLVDAAHPTKEREAVIMGDIGLPDGVKFFVKLDALDREAREIGDYKTTNNPDGWQQWKVDQHMQLSVYAFVWHEIYHEFLREMWIQRMNTKNGNAKMFYTTRGPEDIKLARKWIAEAVNEMQESHLWEQRKSKEELELERSNKLNI